MAEENQNVPQPQEMAITNTPGILILGQIELQGDPVICKVQPDGTLRIYSLTVGRDSAGNDKVVNVEPTGEQRNVMMGETLAGTIERLLLENDQTLREQTILWDGAGQVRWLADAAGKAHVIMNGDDGGVISPIEVNPVKVAVELNNSVLAQAAPGAPSTEFVVYTVPVNGANIREIHVTKEGAGSSRFSLGVSLGGGALVSGEFLRDESSLARGGFDKILFEGGLLLASGDEIRAEVDDTDIVFTVVGEAL